MPKTRTRRGIALFTGLASMTAVLAVGAGAQPSYAQAPCTTSGPTVTRTGTGAEIALTVSCSTSQSVDIGLNVLGVGGTTLAGVRTTTTVAADATTTQRVTVPLPVQQACVTVNGTTRCLP
ncbi:hypothetical protein [Planobispora takensis]|uniref:Uncharacterized protein n=1 Tax=Planobispora takensis TaxID=1367882 RepID=A0A8J3SVX6_9ACTN|nr:hypothetical protein [Planobispora takensis]GII00087.1 hypothetical protein Pta02_20950 [Planobispora takensis]